MSKAALYAGLSGGAQAWGNVAEKEQEAELSEAAQAAQEKREKRLAQYQAGLNKEATEYEYGLKSELAKEEAGLLAKGGWETVKKIDRLTGEEKIFLFNGNNGEFKDAEAAPNVAGVEHYEQIAEDDYDVDVSGDATFMKLIANQDYDGAMLRAKHLAAQKKKNGKPERPERPERTEDPAVANARKALLREQGNPDAKKGGGFGVLGDKIKGGWDALQEYDANNHEATLANIKKSLDLGLPPSEESIARLTRLSSAELKDLGASASLIRLVEASRKATK